MQLKGETVLQLAINCGDSQQALADINISHYWNIKATTEEHVATTVAQCKISRGKHFANFMGQSKIIKKFLSLSIADAWCELKLNHAIFAFHQN